MKNYILFFFGLIVCSSAFSQDSTSKWKVLETKDSCNRRHEACFVECDGKFYLMGGRGLKPVEEFNPETSNWKVVADPPMEFNHFQTISFQHEIYELCRLLL
ncbi:MAG: hypothetical protein JJE22_07645 [Bacteroidia bacterium]|nr:hypothetical protein [Bacteroidia bacterium]